MTKMSLRDSKKNLETNIMWAQATNLNKAESDLAATLPRHRFNFWSRQKVNLYVLDMYYPRGTTNTPEQRAQLAKTWSDFCKSNRKLKEVLTNLDQSFDGGRELADQVKRRGFVRTPPFVFFTRKGNLEDAVMAYEQVKAVAVIKKPDPWDDDTSEEAKDTALYDMACTRFRRHRVRCFYGTGGESWKDEGLHASSRFNGPRGGSTAECNEIAPSHTLPQAQA
jgi:hypothetical protein